MGYFLMDIGGGVVLKYQYDQCQDDVFGGEIKFFFEDIGIWYEYLECGNYKKQ